ncbi:MAG: SCE4755 family polysaccharide monooxygenase-like protein [Acidobacteriota bacterium]
MKISGFLPVVSVFLTVIAPQASAHFKLLEPAGWLQEDAKGDPQKMAPCGGTSANAGTPSGAVNSVQGGEKLHLKLQETVYHPGFYRVALAVNSRDELPRDPEAKTEPSANGPRSVSGAVQYPPTAPVLADGLFMHTSKFEKEVETDIDIPNINCSKCTLQIVEFMASHGLNKDGDYTYHHCAVLQIKANPSKPIDARYPAEKP